MESFRIAVTAVTPFLIYMVYGFIMRRAGVADETFLNKLNAVVFRAFFPFISFYNLYSIDPDMEFHFSFVLFGLALVAVLLVILLLTVPRVVKEPSQTGVMIQALYRSNAVLYALPLAESIYGKQGASLAAMMISLVVPFYNVMAVIILEHYRGRSASGKDLFKKVITNPLILGAVVGMLFYVLHIHLPAALDKPFSVFNSLATPLSLFVLGGTLHFAETGKYRSKIAAVIALKLAAVPFLVLVLATLAGFRGPERFVIFSVFATPTAVASYPMAVNMGGDGQLAGQIVVFTTVVSVLTLFLWIFGMSRLQML